MELATAVVCTSGHLVTEGVISLTTIREAFFVAGGTVPPGSPSYVERSADRELFEALLSGEYCYVLNSRQMGKSSLAVRTVTRLQEAGVTTAFVDLTRIGSSSVTEEQWYLGILAEIGRGLGLRKDVAAFVKDQSSLAPGQRLFTFLQDVVARLGVPVVLMIDEVDAVRSLPFSTDGFFAGLRQLHNGRASDPELASLTFCLLGAALPSDLIRDARVTPFNVGRRIELKDFTVHEATALEGGLLDRLRRPVAALPSEPAIESTTRKAIERVMFWTGGHPFLTQTLCAALAEHDTPSVDALVKQRYLEARARETDTNLADVGNRLLGRGDPNVNDHQRADTLCFYDKLLKSGIPDDESNPSAARIKMSGVARLENGQLKIRNRIYAEVFGRTWIRENMPGQELRRQKKAFWKGALRTMAVAGAVIGTIAYLAWQNKKLAETRERERNAAQYEAYASAMSNLSTYWDRRNHDEIRRTLDRLAKSPYRGWEWEFWNARIGGAQSLFDSEGAPLPRVSPDGKLVAYCTGRWAMFLDARNLKFVRKFRLPARGFNMWWTPSGTLIEEDLDGRGRDLELDAVSGKVIRNFGTQYLSWHPDAFSADGRWTLSVDTQGETGILDLSTGARRRAEGVRLTSLGFFLPKSNTVAIYVPRYRKSAEFSVVFIDRRTGKESAKPIPGKARLGSMAVSPDGQFLAVATDTMKLRIYDLPHRTELCKIDTKERIGLLQFSTDGKRLLAACANRLGLLYSVDHAGAHLMGEIPSTNVLWFVPGTHRMLAAYGLMRLVNEDDVWNSKRVGLPPSPLATGWYGETAVGIYKQDGHKAVFSLTPGHSAVPKYLESVSNYAGLAEDGTLVIGAGARRTMRDPVKHRDLIKVPSPDSGIWSLISSDGRVAVVRYVGKIATWDLVHGVLLKDSTQEDFTSMALSPDGRHLALGRYDGGLELRRTDDLTIQWTSAPHFRTINHLEFSPDGRLVTSSSDDDTGGVVEASTGRLVSRLVGHGQTVFATISSPDLRRVATCGDDQTVRLWDSVTGRELTTLETKAEVVQLKYSADGTSLYGIDRDGRVYTWSTNIEIR